MKLKIALIRHGEPEKSDGELLGGSDDGSLSENSKKNIQEKCAANAYPTLKHVYSCALVCCRDTAALIYPVPVVILKALGTFEPVTSDGQAQQKPSDNRVPLNIETLYDANVKAGNIIRRVSAEMEIKKAEQCALISRKMVILEILRRHCVPRSSYEDWELPFGGGYLIEYDTVEETARILSII